MLITLNLPYAHSNQEFTFLFIYYPPSRSKTVTIMNTQNKDGTVQDTSDVDVAPASSSPKQEDDDGNESEKEMTTTTTMAPENKDKKKNKDEDFEKDMKKEGGQCFSAIVCSFCGLPQTETRNFDKLICPCKSTRYCNTTCQRNHWLDHKKNCKHLRVERK